MGLLVNTMRTEEKMNETQIREQIEGLRQRNLLWIDLLGDRNPFGLFVVLSLIAKLHVRAERPDH